MPDSVPGMYHDARCPSPKLPSLGRPENGTPFPCPNPFPASHEATFSAEQAVRGGLLLSSEEGGHGRKRKNRSRHILGCHIQCLLNLVRKPSIHRASRGWYVKSHHGVMLCLSAPWTESLRENRLNRGAGSHFPAKETGPWRPSAVLSVDE